MFTIANLKKSVLNLMSLNGEDLENKTINELEEDDNYRDYLLAFNDSFNRGLGQIQAKKKMPLKRAIYSVDTKTNADIDLTTKANDIYSVSYVSFKNENNNKVRVAYQKFGNYIEIYSEFKGNMVVYYHRSIKYTFNDNDFDLEENYGFSSAIENALANYIASELYLGDDSSMAQLFLNKYEAFINEVEEDIETSVQEIISSNWE